jgi:hypothetical protein
VVASVHPAWSNITCADAITCFCAAQVCCMRPGKSGESHCQPLNTLDVLGSSHHTSLSCYGMPLDYCVR